MGVVGRVALQKRARLRYMLIYPTLAGFEMVSQPAAHKSVSIFGAFLNVIACSRIAVTQIEQLTITAHL